MRNTKVRMERRHFEKIAEVIRFMPVTREMRTIVAREFADGLRGTNENFKRERFIEAATEPRADDRAAAE